MPDTTRPISPFPPMTPTSEDRRQAPRDEAESVPAPAWLERHWQKLASACGLLAGAWLYAVSLIGIHTTGPAELAAAQARRDTALAARVTALEQRASGMDRTLNVQGYILCLNNRVRDPAVLEACAKIRREFLETRRAP